MSFRRGHSSPSGLGAAYGDGLIAAVEVLYIAVGRLLQQPVVAVPLVGFGGLAGGLVYLLGLEAGGVAFGGLAVAVVAGLVGWRWVTPVVFSRLVGAPARNAWCRLWTYRAWRHVMIGCGVYKRHIGRDGEPGRRLLTPVILRVERGPWRDMLLIGLRKGQNPAHLETDDVLGAIRHEFDALAVRVRVEKARDGSRKEKRTKLWVEVMTDDPLNHELAPLPIADVVDLEAVPIGIRDTGEPWTIKLLGAHQLIVGQMGSGKGSVIWSIIWGVASYVRSGLVQVWGIDPKGGMELGLGRGIFTRFVDDDGAAAARMLEELVEIMKARAKRQSAIKSRKLVPSLREPLIICVIDEILSLLVFADNDVRKRIEAALGKLLTQGRAPGIVIVGATQNPRKEMLKLRDEFNCRVCLAVAAETHPDMALGPGARDRGARCDDPIVIPKSLPGIGFVHIDGERELARVRASYPRDKDIIWLADTYGPTTTPQGSARAVLEGQGVGAGIPLTAKQAADLNARMAAWAAEDANVAGEAEAEAEQDTAEFEALELGGERPRSAA